MPEHGGAGAEEPRCGHGRVETEARRNAELPLGTVSEKRGSCSLFFLRQLSQPGLGARTGFILGVRWGAGRLGIQGGHKSWSRVAGPARAWAGTRPVGTAGDTRGWWLQSEATRGAPQLPGETAPAPWDVNGHLEVTPSQPARCPGTLVIGL